MITNLLIVCVFAVSLAHITNTAPKDPTLGCRPIADVIFLLDGSDSISDQEFRQQIEFVRRFVHLSDISPESVRVGLTVVSSAIGDEYPLSLNSTKENLMLVLDSITQPQEGSRTDLGLVEMEQLFSRHARRGILRIGVILTDGRAKYVRATEGEAQVVKDAGIILIAIGVGRLIQFTELEKIATTKENAYSLEPIDISTKFLADTVAFLGQESCTGHLLVSEFGLNPSAQTIETNNQSTAAQTGNTFSSKAPVLTSQPAIQITEPYLSLSSNSKSKGNSFGRVIGSNLVSDVTNPKNSLSVSNTFDVKMEPFVAMKPLKSRVPNTNIGLPIDQMQFSRFDSLVNDASSPFSASGVYNISQGSNILSMNSIQQSFNRFTLPKAVLTPSPSISMQPTAPKTTLSPNRPVINTTPKTLLTTAAVTRSPPVVFEYQDSNPTPSETADKIIQSLINNKDHLNGQLSGMNPFSGLAPDIQPARESIPEINPLKGVGVKLRGPSAAETLAFLKKEMHPPRTFEEHLNPVFQMFNGAASATGRTKSAKEQTTQTTVSPKKAFMRAEMAAMRDHCSKGRFVDGIAYTSKPRSCTEFLQCFQEAGSLKVRVVRCPFETFFDDQHSVCRHHEQQMCLTDPCSDRMMTSYDHQGNCRAYWSCVRGQSVPVCCPSGTSYVSGFGCARNATCTDTCMDFGNLNAVTLASECKLLAMDADPHFYFENVAGMGWVVRMCAQGMKFDQIQCKCKGTNEATIDVCKPELYMDFESGLLDMSGNNLAMGIYNVELDGGAGAFSGKSHLKLWRFSGMSLGQHVTISFRFRTSVTAPKGRLMHIVSNCCYTCAGQPQPSLDIAIIPGDQGGVAVFSTTTREAGEIFLFVPFKDTFTGWNNLEYRYDGLKMKGTVNGQSAQKNIVGKLLGKSEPLLIGACGMANAYDGFLDEFKFYMCNP